MAYVQNGRRISGRDAIRETTGGNPKRRAVISRGSHFETIDPYKTYTQDELYGKKGKITSIPERTKGGFGGRRNEFSKRVIEEQIFDVSEKLFKGQNIQYDDKDFHWMVIPRYKLPKNWHHIAKETPLRISFPREYPYKPAIGFYLKSYLPQSANGHLYDQAYHEADQYPLEKGWSWYCVYIENGAWRPANMKYPGDWRKGDNLWTYFQLIAEVLGSNDD